MANASLEPSKTCSILSVYPRKQNSVKVLLLSFLNFYGRLSKFQFQFQTTKSAGATTNWKSQICRCKMSQEPLRKTSERKQITLRVTLCATSFESKSFLICSGKPTALSIKIQTWVKHLKRGWNIWYKSPIKRTLSERKTNKQYSVGKTNGWIWREHVV